MMQKSLAQIVGPTDRPENAVGFQHVQPKARGPIVSQRAHVDTLIPFTKRQAANPSLTHTWPSLLISPKSAVEIEASSPDARWMHHQRPWQGMQAEIGPASWLLVLFEYERGHVKNIKRGTTC